MKNLDRLKQRLVGDAVSENVDLILGRVSRRHAPKRSVVWPVASTVLPILLVVGGAVSVLLWAQRHPVATFSDADLATSLRAASEQPVAPLIEAEEVAASVAPTVPEVLSPAMTLEAPLYDAPERVDRAVFPLGVQRVVVDPGHGGANAGTRASGLAEKDITLDLALRLRGLLEDAGFEVLLTRTEDVAIDLVDRVAFANEQRGDVFVSIHVNWLGERAGRGIETFHLGPTDDPYLTRLTGDENRQSGYSLTDFRHLLAGIYEDLREDDSRDLASSLHRSLYGRLRQIAPGLEDRGVKTAPFVVLIGTQMPAVLAEVGCLSDDQDVELLRSDDYRQTIAKALHDGVIAYAAGLDAPIPPAQVASSPAP